MSFLVDLRISTSSNTYLGLKGHLINTLGISEGINTVLEVQKFFNAEPDGVLL